MLGAELVCEDDTAHQHPISKLNICNEAGLISILILMILAKFRYENNSYCYYSHSVIVFYQLFSISGDSKYVNV